MVKTKVFFASDIHGSDRCFRKFVTAGKFYGADVVILSGDITGKDVVLMTELPDGTIKVRFGGRELRLKFRYEIESIKKSVSDAGNYSYVADQKEIEELEARPEMLGALLKRLSVESIKAWVGLADETLAGSKTRCYISPGEADGFEIDDVLGSGRFVVAPEGKVVDVDGQHEMITLGFANRTPWNRPREVDEDALRERIDRMAEKVARMPDAIFNIHAPPVNTPLDQAPKLDDGLRPMVSGGQVVMVSSGSSAVRASVEKYQPLLALHGHVDESKGSVKIGRTACFNPGSDYASGVLRGVLCLLEDSAIKSQMFTSG